MPYGEYAECPNCGKIAHGEEEIEELFGYRNMGDEKAYLTTGANATNCWCKMTLPMVTNWLFGMQLNTAADCNRQCAYDCITLSTTFYSGSSSVLY